MGFGDFWLQSNNGKKKYNLNDFKNLKDIKGEDIAKNPKFKKLIEIFNWDSDGDGKISVRNTQRKNEWESVFADLQQAAVDNDLTSEEFGLYISKKSQNADIKLEDVEEFLDAASKTEAETVTQIGNKTIIRKNGIVTVKIEPNITILAKKVNENGQYSEEDLIEMKTVDSDSKEITVKREEFKTKTGTIKLISETKKINDKESITTVYSTDSFYFYEILKGQESSKAMESYKKGDDEYFVQYMEEGTITHAANGDSINSLIKKFGFKDEEEFYKLNPRLNKKIIKVCEPVTVPGHYHANSKKILTQGTIGDEYNAYVKDVRYKEIEKFRQEHLNRINKELFYTLDKIKGFEFNNNNSEMYFKINSFGENGQKAIVNYIQKLTKEGKTPEEIKNAFLYAKDAPQRVLNGGMKVRINLFDGYLISLNGFKGRPLSKDMSIKHFVTEELGLDINKGEGKELYTKLLSIKDSKKLQDLTEMFSAIKLRTTPEYASYHLSEISMCNKSDAYEKYNMKKSGRHSSSYNNNQAYKQTLLDNKPLNKNVAKEMYKAVINKLSAKNPKEVQTKYDSFIKDHMHSKERTFAAMMLSQMLLDEDAQLKEFSKSKSILNPIGKAASTIARYSTINNWKKAEEVENGVFLGNKRIDLLLRLSNPDDGVKFDTAKVHKLMQIQETISKKNKPLYDKISHWEKEYQKITDEKRKEEIKKEIGNIYKTLSEKEPYKSLNKQYQEALINVFGEDLVDGCKGFLKGLDYADSAVDMIMMLLGTHALGKLIAKGAMLLIPRAVQLSSTAATTITGTASTMQKVGSVAFPVLSSGITFPLWNGIKYTTDYYTNDIDETKMGDASYTYSEGLKNTAKHSIAFGLFAGAWGQLTGYGLRLIFKTPAGEKIMEKSCEYLSKECASSGGLTSSEIRAGLNKVRESAAKNWKKTTASFGGEVLGFSMYEVASNIASGMYSIDENGNLYRTEKTDNGVEFQSEMSYLDVGWEQCKTLLSFKALGQILFMRRHEGGMDFSPKMPKEQELQIKPVTKDGKTTYEVKYPDGTTRNVPDMQGVISLSNIHYENVTLYKPLAEILEKKGKMELRDGIVITKEGEVFKISFKDGSEVKSKDLRTAMGQAQGEYANRNYENELVQKGNIELPNGQKVTYDKATNTYRTTIEGGVVVEAGSFKELLQNVQKKTICQSIEKSFTEDKKAIMLDESTLIVKQEDGTYRMRVIEDGFPKEYLGKSVEEVLDMYTGVNKGVNKEVNEGMNKGSKPDEKTVQQEEDRVDEGVTTIPRAPEVSTAPKINAIEKIQMDIRRKKVAEVQDKVNEAIEKARANVCKTKNKQLIELFENVANDGTLFPEEIDLFNKISDINDPKILDYIIKSNKNKLGMQMNRSEIANLVEIDSQVNNPNVKPNSELGKAVQTAKELGIELDTESYNFKQDMRLSTFKEYVTQVNESNRELVNYLYNKYYLADKSPEIQKLSKDIINKYGTYVFVRNPHDISPLEMTANEWQEEFTASNGQVRFTLCLDFSDYKSEYIKGGADGYTNHRETHCIANRVGSLRHEQMHVQDQFLPEGYLAEDSCPYNGIEEILNGKYIEEFRKAGIDEDSIAYAHTSRAEYIAVLATNGDLSKISPEFKSILINDLGMPEWVFNLKRLPLYTNLSAIAQRLSEGQSTIINTESHGKIKIIKLNNNKYKCDIIGNNTTEATEGVNKGVTTIPQSPAIASGSGGIQSFAEISNDFAQNHKSYDLYSDNDGNNVVMIVAVAGERPNVRAGIPFTYEVYRFDKDGNQISEPLRGLSEKEVKKYQLENRQFIDNRVSDNSGTLNSFVIPLPKGIKDWYNERKEKSALKDLKRGKASPEFVKAKQDYVMRFFNEPTESEKNSILNCSQQELAAKLEVAEKLLDCMHRYGGFRKGSIEDYENYFYEDNKEFNFVRKIIEDATPENYENYLGKIGVGGVDTLYAIYLSKNLSPEGFKKISNIARLNVDDISEDKGKTEFEEYTDFWKNVTDEDVRYINQAESSMKILGRGSRMQTVLYNITSANVEIVESAYQKAIALYTEEDLRYNTTADKIAAQLCFLAQNTKNPNSFRSKNIETYTNLYIRGINTELNPQNIVIADAIAKNRNITPEEATKLLTEPQTDINKTLELIKMGTSYDNAVYIQNASPEVRAIEERIVAVERAYSDDIQTFSEKEIIIKNNKINHIRSLIKPQEVNDELRQDLITVFENTRNMEEFDAKYKIFLNIIQGKRRGSLGSAVCRFLNVSGNFMITEQADFAVRFGKYDEKIICNKFGQTYVEYEKLSESYSDFDLTIRSVDDLQKCQQVAGTEAQKERLKELWVNKNLSYQTIIKLLTSNESYEAYNMLKTYKYFDYMSEKDFQCIIDGLVKNKEIVSLVSKNASITEIKDKISLIETQKLLKELLESAKIPVQMNKGNQQDNIDPIECTLEISFPNVDKSKFFEYDAATNELIQIAIQNSQHLSKEELTRILNNTDFSNLKQRVKCKELFKGDEKTVNQNFAKMLLCSDAEYISMIKRFQKYPQLLSENFEQTSLDFVMKMSDAEFERYSTPIAERTAEPFDENSFRTELENTLYQPYRTNMDPYTQSRRGEYSASSIGYDTNYTFDPDRIIKKENTEIKHKTNEQLFDELERTGKIDYTIEDRGGMKPQITDEAVIKPEDVESLGQKRSAKSVVNIGNTRFWDKARRSRDIWQNFYFGNGYTLEGVNITVEKRPNGKLKVRISGKGEFDYERILTLGFSGQTDLARAAGRHGEGTKIITGNLLAGRTVDEVIFASGDWKLSQTRGETLVIDGRADDATTPIEKTLTKNQKRVEGNYFEFETTDEEFVKELVKAKDYFYSPDNPDWANLDAESEYFGIKMLPEGQKGNCYVVQRYEVAGQKGLECTIPGMTLIFKQNPEAEEIVKLNHNKVISLDSGRNRVGLTKDTLTELISTYARTLPEQELVNIIGQMSDIFKITTNIEEHPQYFILKGLINAAHKNGIRIKFEGHDYVAMDAVGLANIETIKACFPNVEFVNSIMTDVGVRGTSSFHEKTNDRIPQTITSQEKRKIQLLDKAIELISENLDLEHIGIFTEEEAHGARYVFEKSNNEDPAGEAIVSGGKSLGHWIERDYLKNYSFYDVLATWMHEISHKVGGDGDYVFNKRLETIEHLITQLCLSNTNFAKKLDMIAQKYADIGGYAGRGRTSGTAEELAQAVNAALEKIKHPELVKDEKIEASNRVSNPRLNWDEIPPDKEKVLKNNHDTFIHPDKDISVAGYNFMGQIVARYIENKSLTRQVETQAQRLEQCIEELAQTGKLLIEIPPKTGNVPIKGSTEITNPTDRAMLGKPEKTNMLIIYNQHQEWSYEMAARDLWQNQNDGLNGTLDGAKLDIERQPNGKYKIKLSSDSEYNYFWLQYIAASNKPTNDNAGGFGEGAKMASRALLHSKAIDKISFASGKWKMDFTREEGVPEDRSHLMNTLYENEIPVKGNYVEFETDNLNLVEAMIKAKDYFRHSDNPDFKDLTFENDDFGYRVLPRDQKGNMYYIQRYALKGEGELDGILDGLEIVFKKKLSRETLREIGIDDDVDRRGFTPDEIGKLSTYFAKSMTDIQLMQAIADLERYMVTTSRENNIKNTPEGKFICGLIDEAVNRRLYFDYNCKYVSLDNASSDVILYLLNNGYVTVDNYMGQVLTYSAQSRYEQMHRAKKCEPTIVEQQKIHLLNEALKVMRGWDNNWYIGISDEIKENVHGNTNISVTIRRDYLENADFTTLLDDILCASCASDGGRANQGYNLTHLLRSNTSNLINIENQAKLGFLKEKYSEIK